MVDIRGLRGNGIDMTTGIGRGTHGLARQRQAVALAPILIDRRTKLRWHVVKGAEDARIRPPYPALWPGLADRVAYRLVGLKSLGG